MTAKHARQAGVAFAGESNHICRIVDDVLPPVVIAKVALGAVVSDALTVAPMIRAIQVPTPIVQVVRQSTVASTMLRHAVKPDNHPLGDGHIGRPVVNGYSMAFVGGVKQAFLGHNVLSGCVASLCERHGKVKQI
jgi:uncharacterized Zn-binding protein involved in type VI secretion